PAAEAARSPELPHAGDARSADLSGAGASTPTGAWLHRARGGDRSALGQLIEGQHSWLKQQARRLWPRRLDRKLSPSDLAQVVNQEAARCIDQCRSRDRAGFRGWLRGILKRVRNEALRYLTAKGRDVEGEEPLPGDSARGSGLHEARTPVELRVAR